MDESGIYGATALQPEYTSNQHVASGVTVNMVPRKSRRVVGAAEKRRSTKRRRSCSWASRQR